MDQGIHTAGGGDGGRGTHDESGVQNGILGNILIAEHTELVVSARVGDDSGGGYLTAGTGGGGDGNDGLDGTGHLVISLIVRDFAAVARQNAHRLGHIHGRAAA